MQFWMLFRILPLKIVSIQEFSFYSHFEIAACLFERIARQSWRTKLQSASITSLTSPPVADNMQYVPRAAPQIFAVYIAKRAKTIQNCIERAKKFKTG